MKVAAEISLNIQEIIEDFPILNQKVNGKRLAYLNSTATSQTPVQVLNVLDDYYKRYNSNVHRGVHTLGFLATDGYESTRETVRRFINAKYFEETIFARSATASINIAIHSYRDTNISGGDEIVMTEMKHHANIMPWRQLAKRKKVTLKFTPMTDDDELGVENVKSTINDNTKIVAIAHVSSVLGTINDIKIIAKIAYEHGAIISVDGAQSAPHMDVDVQDLDADFFSFSGYKMLGPTDIDVLYGKRELLQSMESAEYGGDMIDFVSKYDATWADLPTKFEAGTPIIAQAIGLAEAIRYIESINFDAIHQYEKELTEYAYEQLSPIEGSEIYGPPKERRTGVITFNLADVYPHDVVTAIDTEGVAVRVGHHCAQPLMKWLNVSSTVRASFYIYNTKEDADQLVEALKQTKEFFSYEF